MIKKFLKKVVLAFGLMNMSLGFIYPNIIYAEDKVTIEYVYDVPFEYGWSYDESESNVKKKTLDGAKRRAVEMVCTFLDTYSKEEDFILIKDEIVSVTMGKVKLLSDPRFEMDKEKRICKVSIDARVEVDEEAVKKRIEDLLKKKNGEDHPIIDKTKALPLINKDKSIHYYQLVDWGLDWHAAKEECEKEPRRHLATISSKEEQKFIEEMLRNQGNRNCYWLGGEKVGKEKFFWVDNTPFNYANWAKWQPDRPEEKALMIYKNTNPRATVHTLGTWNDLRADGTFPNEDDFFGLDHFGFICEWDY